MAHPQSKSQFVAVEYGGRWTPEPSPGCGHDLILLVQHADESPSEFARRFIRKVTSTATAGTVVDSAILVVAPEFGLSHLEARCAIARTLVCSFSVDVDHELILMTARNVALQCRPHLLALAEIFREGAKRNCSIRVHGEGPRAQSRVMPKPELALRRLAG